MKICIVVRGGMVQSVFVDSPDAEVDVLDFDTDDNEELDSMDETLEAFCEKPGVWNVW